jgi:hypothetical protein
MQVEDSAFIIKPFFAHPSVMMRKQILDKLPYVYNENYRYSQDLELWGRLFFLTKFYNLPEVLLQYRKSSEQVTKRKKEEQLQNARYIRRSFLKKLIKEEFSEDFSFNSFNLSTYRQLKDYLVRLNCLSSKGLESHLVCIYRSLPRRNRLLIIGDVVKDLFMHRIHFRSFGGFLLSFRESSASYI